MVASDVCFLLHTLETRSCGQGLRIGEILRESVAPHLPISASPCLRVRPTCVCLTVGERRRLENGAYLGKHALGFLEIGVDLQGLFQELDCLEQVLRLHEKDA